MSRWLLSGHNPQETLGISYPLSASYIADFTSRQQMEYVLKSLAGGTDHFDFSMPLIPRVGGLLYSNVNYCLRNIASVFPFDPASIGVPKGLVTSEHKPPLTTLLLLPFRFWRLYRRATHNLRTVLPRFRETLDEIYWQLRDANPDHLTARDLALIDRLFEPAMLDCMTAYANALLVIGLPNISVLQWVNDKAPALRNLLVGHGTNTAQLGERIWELRQVAMQCGPPVVQALRQGADLDAYRALPEAAPFLERLTHFLHTYGHRAFHYASEFEATRLVDQPQLVLLAIAGLLEEGEAPAVRAHNARKASLRALQEMPPLRRLFWRQLLKWGGALIEGREENRNTMELQNATYGLAARLLSQHYFQSPDHLWLYQFDEFLAFGQSQGKIRVDVEVIARRRAELAQDRRQTTPPELIWYDPETKEWWPVDGEQPGPSTAVRLQGIGVSAGSGPVEGVALVTNSAQEAAERLLDISGPVVLVTHMTDPVWSSLFPRLTAVVTEMGGAISHAAIVARENGLPAVVAAAEATGRIRDGQRVRVDGAAGSVEVIG